MHITDNNESRQLLTIIIIILTFLVAQKAPSCSLAITSLPLFQSVKNHWPTFLPSFLIFGVYMCEFMYLHVCADACVLYVHVESRGWHWVSSSVIFCLISEDRTSSDILFVRVLSFLELHINRTISSIVHIVYSLHHLYSILSIIHIIYHQYCL